jgi:hypothetical protein
VAFLLFVPSSMLVDGKHTDDLAGQSETDPMKRHRVVILFLRFGFLRRYDDARPRRAVLDNLIDEVNHSSHGGGVARSGIIKYRHQNPVLGLLTPNSQHRRQPANALSKAFIVGVSNLVSRGLDTSKAQRRRIQHAISAARPDPPVALFTVSLLITPTYPSQEEINSHPRPM